MVSAAQIYWLTRLDNISITFGILAMLLSIGLIITTVIRIMMTIDDDDIPTEFRRVWNFLAISTAITFAVGTFVPTSKEAAAMYVIPKIANSETVQELGDQVKTLAVE